MLTLNPKDMKLEAYIDTSFAPHADSKSKTGVVIFVGGQPVNVVLRKQKCVTKSPPKLVALSDFIMLIKLFAECIAFITNSNKGNDKVRTKYLHDRINLCKEGVDSKSFELLMLGLTG